eukprot:9816024-Ditylum_brightwellii.AAC.1
MEAKWEKFKAYVKEWEEVCRIAKAHGIALNFNRKLLESDQGVLVHIARIYPWIVPYLKGIHLTLESWQPDRDDKDWKLSSKVWGELIDSLGETEQEMDQPPEN